MTTSQTTADEISNEMPSLEMESQDASSRIAYPPPTPYPMMGAASTEEMPSFAMDGDNLGGYSQYGVAAASRAENQLDVFTIGKDSAMYNKSWNGSAWSDWERLGGYCISAPAAVARGENRIDTFVIGGDRSVYHKGWDGSAWSDWLNLGGLLSVRCRSCFLGRKSAGSFYRQLGWSHIPKVLGWLQME